MTEMNCDNLVNKIMRFTMAKAMKKKAVKKAAKK